MKRLTLVVLCVLAARLCPAVSPAEMSPADAVRYIQSFQEDPDRLRRDLAEVLPFLTDRRTVPGAGGIPQSASSGLQKQFRQNLPGLEEEFVAQYPGQPEGVQGVMLDVLGWGEGVESFELLWKGLADDRPAIRSRALDALLRREGESRTAAAARFRELDSVSHAEQARLIGVLKTPESWAGLLYLLEHGDEREVITAEWALEQIGFTILPNLFDAYSASKSEVFNERLLRVLCDLKHEDSIQFLAGELQEGRPVNRRIVILNHCSFMQEANLKAAALDALFSETLAVKLSAIAALGRSEDPLMAVPLACIDVKGPEVVSDYTAPAIRALGEDAARLLVGSLQFRNADIQNACIRGIQSIHEGAVPMMLRMIIFPGLRVETRQTLVNLLKRIENPEGPPDQIAFYRLAAFFPVEPTGFREEWLPTYQAVAGHPDPVLRAEALAHLAGFQDPKSTDLLVGALKDAEASVSRAAGKALRSRLYSIRDQAVKMMKTEPYWSGRNIALGLQEAGYEPHRIPDRAELYTSLGRWTSLDRLPEEARTYLVEQWWHSKNTDAAVRYALALNQMDPAPFREMSWAKEISEEALAWMPWQPAEKRVNAFKRLNQVSAQDQKRLLVLAAVSSDEGLRLAVREFMSRADSIPLDVWMAMLNTRNPRLAARARDMLQSGTALNPDGLEEAMLEAAPQTGKVLAELLSAREYTPRSEEAALSYYSYLESWDELAARGDAGVSVLRESLDNAVGRKKLDLVLLLSTLFQEDALWNVLNALQMDENLYPYILQYFREQDVPAMERLQKTLLMANLDQTPLVVRLLTDLKALPEDPVGKVVLSLAGGAPAALNDLEALRQFYANELISGHPARVWRASIWRMSRPARPETAEAVSFASIEEFQQALGSTNVNEIYAALSAAPILAESIDEKDAVVNSLIDLLKDRKPGDMPPAEKVVQALAEVGDPAADALKELWNYGSKTERTLAGQSISKIPSKSLVGIQKKMVGDPDFLTGVQEDAVRSIARLQDPAYMEFLFQLAAGGQVELRGEAQAAMRSYEAQALDFLLEKLESGEGGQQRLAVSLLSDIEDPRVAASFERRVVSSPSSLQAALIRALGDLHQASSLPILAGLLNHPSGSTYLTASDVLADWGPQAFPHVVQDLNHGSRDTQVKKLATLRRMTGQDFGLDRSAWRRWAKESGYLSPEEPADP